MRYVIRPRTRLVFGSLAWVFAAANTVPASKAGQHSKAITVNDLRPTHCAALTLTTIRSGSGDIDGTSGNDLILGSTAAQRIRGDDGNDCIVGGGGNDEIEGGGGTNVCIGGNGSDTFRDCATVVQGG